MKAGYWLLLVLIVAIAATAGATWLIMRPTKIIETPAPEVKQADGSIIVERRPNANAKPKQQIPKGSKVERTGEITVQGATPPEIAACTPTKCPPVSIDTTLVRNVDGSRRLIVSSPDGQITRAVDIPVETAAPPPEPKQWAAGVSYSPTRQTSGIWIERDIARLRIGAELNQVRPIVTSPPGVEARLRIGWTF